MVKIVKSGPGIGFLDSRYLKLDASNDPITDDLEIVGVLTVTTGTTGQSTIGAGLIVNNDSGSGAINDFQVNSDTLTAIFVDASADTMAIGVDTTINDGKNIVLNTTTGTKIGTAVSQKLGFWNVTPVIQPVGATQAAPAAYATGAFGLDSDANMQALYDLVVAMRTALVNVGIIKGAA